MPLPWQRNHKKQNPEKPIKDLDKKESNEPKPRGRPKSEK